MSNGTQKGAHALAIRQNLDESIESLTRWLCEPNVANSAPAHADESRYERLAWHYGYLIALRDVRELLAAA
jgi:hypothetical protein